MTNNIDLRQELKYILTLINDWLKYAEAKHGGLIILNSGLVIGILSSYGNIQSYISKLPTLFGLVCFGISVFLSILSQFPVTKNIFYLSNEVINPNLYFFGNLSQMDEKSFISELSKIESSFQPGKMDKDLINQILINSRITNNKLTIFKFASYLTAFGAGLIGISSVVKIIWHF